MQLIVLLMYAKQTYKKHFKTLQVFETALTSHGVLVGIFDWNGYLVFRVEYSFNWDGLLAVHVFLLAYFSIGMVYLVSLA